MQKKLKKYLAYQIQQPIPKSWILFFFLMKFLLFFLFLIYLKQSILSSTKVEGIKILCSSWISYFCSSHKNNILSSINLIKNFSSKILGHEIVGMHFKNDFSPSEALFHRNRCLWKSKNFQLSPLLVLGFKAINLLTLETNWRRLDFSSYIFKNQWITYHIGNPEKFVERFSFLIFESLLPWYCTILYWIFHH